MQLFILLTAIKLPPARGELAVASPPTVFIPGATFTMGTPITNQRSPKYHDDELPLEVTVDDFRVGKCPVTAEEMCAFLNSQEAKNHNLESLYNHQDIGGYLYSTIELAADGKYVPRRDAARSPANQVTWKGAVLFCDWLSKKTGESYRLPTEAEWELAARGKELRPWPWGKEGPTAKMGPRYNAKFLHNSKELADLRKAGLPTWDTTPVGSHPANATPEGVHDLLAYIIGEWCATKYVPHPTAEQATTVDMDLSELEAERVIRGYYHRSNTGLWYVVVMTHAGRPWTRYYSHPIDDVRHAARYGFRVAQDVGE
jgi:formylglycine-generating enzyme required for sulfatase activity